MSTPPGGIDAQLAGYLAKRDLFHARRVQQVIDRLTPFEARLLREAAVMGYVRGSLYSGPLRDRLPKDHVMIRDVIDSCLAGERRRFPLIHALAEGADIPKDQVNGYIPGNPDEL